MKLNTTSDGACVFGFDLSDTRATYVGLDTYARVVEQGKVAMTKAGLEKLLRGRKKSLVAIEAGTHSPWVSRLLAELGHQVLVANPRQVPLIFRSKRKSDHLDATTLARLARSDPELLHPLTHRGQQAQNDLAVLRSRDALVSTRTQLINHVRGVVKSTGGRLPKCSTEAFHRKATAHIPSGLKPALDDILHEIGRLTTLIDRYDDRVESMAHERYPEALLVRQPNGVGPITSLAFVLTLEDTQRFASSRDVPAYLGLTPARKQSGLSDPNMHITKAGDVFLRRLLVQSAQYVLGPFGTDCDLRRWGLRLAGEPDSRGRRPRKKRAVIAVARKLAVLLHTLWAKQSIYEPLRCLVRKEAA